MDVSLGHRPTSQKLSMDVLFVHRLAETDKNKSFLYTVDPYKFISVRGISLPGGSVGIIGVLFSTED